MNNFDELNLHPTLQKSLAYMEYSQPTPIQAQAIPLAIEGHDIMGTAQTGTGKTAAFAIPLVEKLLADPTCTGLVLTPTRELGKQIMDIMHKLIGPKSPIKTAFIIGGEPMPKQLKQLNNRPRLIVGTPGRINDHLDRGTLDLDNARFLVLDETDRMLDMGFTDQLETIFSYMPEQRQTLMFSATLPQNILKMSEKYMSAPKRVSVGEVNTIAKNIKQEVIRIEQSKKYPELLNQLQEREGSVIVFVKTKFGADKMATNLRKDGFTSEALHGDLRQNKRDKVMQNFRKMNFRILIATDIAARGLDVPHIEHVINFDLPQVAEDFIHRMGRTARAGAEGSAISFVSNQEGRKWHAIERLLNPEAANDRGEERRGFKKKPQRKRNNASRNDFERKERKPRPERQDRPDSRSENRNDKRPKKNREFNSSKPERHERSDKPKFGSKGKSFEKKPRRDRDHAANGEQPLRKKDRGANKAKNFDKRSDENRSDKSRDNRNDNRSEKKNNFKQERRDGKPNNKAGKKPFNKSSKKPSGFKPAGAKSAKRPNSRPNKKRAA